MTDKTLLFAGACGPRWALDRVPGIEIVRQLSETEWEVLVPVTDEIVRQLADDGYAEWHSRDGMIEFVAEDT